MEEKDIVVLGGLGLFLFAMIFCQILKTRNKKSYIKKKIKLTLIQFTRNLKS